jgi:hypothetical protein
MDVSDRMDQTDTRQSNYDRSSESRRSKRVGGDSSRHVVCGGAINGSPELELAHTMGLQARFSLHLDDLWDEGILTEGLAGSRRRAIVGNFGEVAGSYRGSPAPILPPVAAA